MIKKIMLTITTLLILTTGIFAAAVEKTDGFVCPVFNDNSKVGEKNPNAIEISNGDYTIVGPKVSVPITATNDNGQGSPAGNHSSPNDKTYTAIWG